MSVFGSRAFPHLEDVREFVRALYEKHPAAVVISGGADGVDKTAEAEALALGGAIISFRPAKVGQDEYAIDRWELGTAQPYKVQLGPPHPTWANYASAAIYRDCLIAEEGEVGVCFWDRQSRGAGATKDFVERWERKPLYLYTSEERFVA